MIFYADTGGESEAGGLFAFPAATGYRRVGLTQTVFAKAGYRGDSYARGVHHKFYDSRNGDMHSPALITSTAWSPRVVH